MKTLASGVRTKLLAGVAVAVPAVATFLALRFLFQSLDAVLGPWIGTLIGRQTPGLGVIATVILLWIIGMIATHYLGSGRRWKEIVDMNPGLDPAKLMPGQVILLPEK